MRPLRAPLTALIGLTIAVIYALPAQAGNWLRAETDHFVIYSNVGQTSTRDYLRQLEAFKYLSELLLGANPRSTVSSAKFTIYLFDDRDLLKTVRPDIGKYSAGVYMHCVEGAQAFVSQPLNYDSTQDDIALIILQHEYAHHLMYSRMQRFYPSWYSEGFAEYLSTVTLNRGALSVGRDHSERSRTLADETGSWIDFRLLLDPAKYAEAAAKNRIDVFHFYAQAWLLSHYMLTDSQRTKAFNNYFARIGRGEDPIASFESETGITVGKLPGLLRAYWRRLPGLRVTVPDLPDSAVSVTRLPDEQSDYFFEAAVLETCPSEEYGKQLTEQLRAMRPKHGKEAAFQLALARAELLFGDAGAARAILQSLAAADQTSFEQHYLLGRSFYDAALKDPQQPSWMQDATSEFLAAYKLNKLHAPNLYFLSKSLDDNNAPTKTLLNAAVAANVLAPSIPEYALNAAIISMRSGNANQAIHAMQAFASNPHDPKHAARVTAMISAIKDGKSLPDVMAAYAAE